MASINTGDYVAIGEAAELTGMSVHALRYYERENLLIGTVARSSGGNRLYSSMDVDWLQICVKLRDSGMPLSELKRFAALVREGPGNEEQRLQILADHRERVEVQIQVLEKSRAVIDWKVGVYTEFLRGDTSSGLWDPRAEISNADPEDPTTVLSEL